MEKIIFVSLTYNDNTKTYVKADAIVQLIEGKNQTYVYTSNSVSPMFVKERMDEILAKIGGNAR